MNMIFCVLLLGQYYGQNKVQYADFDFKVLSAEHFELYFYPGGEDLAAFAEDVLEDGYKKINEDFKTEIDFKIPVILYNSPNDFSQTNVTLELIEESVGGFTEILKNRMVIPFTGDYEEFRHVLVHELTHVFEFAIFFPSRLEAIVSGDLFYTIPLWAMEGAAEFESVGWDAEADVFMRDLIMNNNVIPLSLLESYGGYVIYKEGQAFYEYVEKKYGRPKVAEFVHMLKNKKNVENTFLAVFGVTVNDFNNRFVRYFQLKYWPKIGLQENFENLARVIFDHKKTNSLYNTSPAISPNGDKVAFISDRQGTAEIIIVSSIDGRILKRLVKSEYVSGYEGLHLYQGGLSWSPDEKYVAYAAKSRGEDALYIVNSANGRVYRKHRLKLDGIYSPCFSPDGKKIYFSGLNDSYSDIYVLDVESGRREKITDDIYTDKYPSVNRDGEVLFVSDRPDSNGDYSFGNYAVYRKAGDRDCERLTPRSSYVASPFFGVDSGIYFIADYDSAYNLYYFSTTAQRITKKTDILTGVYYPSASSSGNKIAFSYLNDFGYDICVVKDPLDKLSETGTMDTVLVENVYEPSDLDPERVRNYRPKFTIDYFTVSASYYTALGLSGLSEIALSDILGNHHIGVGANIYGSLTDSDFFLNYWYLKERADFGAAFFQQLNYYSDAYDLVVWRYLGFGVMAQYPWDRFIRTELGLYAYKIYETRYRDFFDPYLPTYATDTSYNFFYPEIAMVYDNAQWGETGPINGRRARLSGYVTMFSDFNIRSAQLDYRRYLRLTPRASLAGRCVLAGSFADDVDIWSIGGAGSLRGFDYYAFNGSKVGFLNLEFRFPFIDRLKIAFPLPLEIKNVRGALLTDLGAVARDSFQLYDTENGFQLKDLHMGVGAGLRFNLFFIIFKLDVARATNLKYWIDENGARSTWKWYLTLGPEW